MHRSEIAGMLLEIHREPKQTQQTTRTDLLKVLEITENAKMWHQGDSWRDGGSRERAAWEKQMNNINASIFILSKLIKETK